MGNKFLEQLQITFRRDPSNFRPRINTVETTSFWKMNRLLEIGNRLLVAPLSPIPTFLLMIYIEIANYECHPVSMTSLVEHCCTEVRFSCFLSGGFANMAVINPPERKLKKCTSVYCALKVWSCYCVSK